MFLRRFTDFILQNRLQAMAIVFVIGFIPIVGGTISLIIAILVTLRKGPLEGFSLLIMATLPYIVSYYVAAPVAAQTQIIVWTMLVMIASNFLIWVLAIILRRFNNWSFTIEVAALLGIFLIGMIHAIYPDIQQWWAGKFNEYLLKAVKSVGELKSEVSQPKLTESQLQAIAEIKYYATGLAVASVLFNGILLLIAARWWQAFLFNPGGLRKELYQIRLGHMTGIIFIIGLILAYMKNEFALDAMPVLFAAYFITGLSLLHQFVSTRKNNWLWLGVIYAVIIFLFPRSVIIIAMIALFDTGFDFRKRFS